MESGIDFRKPEAFVVETLGEPSIPSPVRLSQRYGEGIASFVPDDIRIRYDIEFVPGIPEADTSCFEKAGPRGRVFFDPENTRAAIVTCGGLCPGLNNVIRSAFMELHFNYEVPEVLGIRYGYAGLNPARGFEPVKITEDMVEASLNDGGTILGSSRGAEDPAIMVDFLQQEQINVLLCVGGDGTQRGALAIANEVRSRNACIAVVGVPKTIDNDIMYVSRTFGFGTAIDRARDVLDSAHAESKGAPFGIGLVKLMGREAGFIAVGATLASQQVNFCLIPEVPLVLEGERGFLNILRERMVTRRHAVIAVAEGAGQDLFSETNAGQDASGNIKPRDIGAFLKTRITEHFARTGPPINLKYIDPSYYIRSVPANTSDALLCDQFARHAVHAAMAGKTALVIGFWNDRFVHVPISAAVAEKKRVRPDSEAWRSVLASTGQPASFL